MRSRNLFRIPSIAPETTTEPEISTASWMSNKLIHRGSQSPRLIQSRAAGLLRPQKEIAMRYLICLVNLLLWAGTTHAQHLFVGLEGSAPPTRSTDLSGFPDVVYTDHFNFDVSGAAATPAGLIYLCNGSFTTQLYSATLSTAPEHLATISVDVSALAYGQGTLWGYSNYASPKGIYTIDLNNGEAALVFDIHTGTGFRFFALDYNPADGLLYGYTEYGDAGLYAIDIDQETVTRLCGTIPASNGQGRGMAVGSNTVYLTATRGDDGIPCYAYDLAQGIGGEWTAFTNPYPTYHSTGGAAWIPDPSADVRGKGDSQPPAGLDLRLVVEPNPINGGTSIIFSVPEGSLQRLRVCDLSGRCVAHLRLGAGMAGTQVATWNGHDHHGTLLAAGTYFLHLEAAGMSCTKKIVLTR